MPYVPGISKSTKTARSATKAKTSRNEDALEPLGVTPSHPLDHLLVLLYPSLDVCQIFDLHQKLTQYLSWKDVARDLSKNVSLAQQKTIVLVVQDAKIRWLRSCQNAVDVPTHG
jgi:hypothetical protein